MLKSPCSSVVPECDRVQGSDENSRSSFGYLKEVCNHQKMKGQQNMQI